MAQRTIPVGHPDVVVHVGGEVSKMSMGVDFHWKQFMLVMVCEFMIKLAGLRIGRMPLAASEVLFAMEDERAYEFLFKF